jgi:hypothetical protein
MPTGLKSFDLRTISDDELVAVMRRGVVAALRRHKRAGVPAIVWDWETHQIVSVPPEQIPDFPDGPGDDDVTK